MPQYAIVIIPYYNEIAITICFRKNVHNSVPSVCERFDIRFGFERLLSVFVFDLIYCMIDLRNRMCVI